MKTDFKTVAAQLRDYALSFPEAEEDFPWGERVVKVKKKVFVFLGKGDDGLGLSTKLPNSRDAALMMPFAEPTGYGLGKAGWVSARFDRGQSIPVAILKEWIRESYCAIAPKKLVQQLTAEPSKAAQTQPDHSRRGRAKG